MGFESLIKLKKDDLEEFILNTWRLGSLQNGTPGSKVDPLGSIGSSRIFQYTDNGTLVATGTRYLMGQDPTVVANLKGQPFYIGYCEFQVNPNSAVTNADSCRFRAFIGAPNNAPPTDVSEVFNWSGIADNYAASARQTLSYLGTFPVCFQTMAFIVALGAGAQFGYNFNFRGLKVEFK